MRMTWVTATIFVLVASVDVLNAKQDNTPNPRVISQKDQITASDQSNKPIDVLTTKKIRTELVNDESLSVSAKNIKIITFNNGVTLKGKVENANERERILKHAYMAAPKHRIYNQLTIVR